MTSARDIPAVLLVGGRGTRLRSVVPNAPKPLAKVGDKSFLDLLVRQLSCQGVCQLVMCTGYLADQIEDHFGDGSKQNVAIRYSRELQPLGTGGAIKLAAPLLDGSSEFLVMNGDSFVEFELEALLEFHHQRQAIVSMIVRSIEDSARYGTVGLQGDRVSKFVEKTGNNAPGMVNAGVYVFRQDVLKYIPSGPCSLEMDVFPGLLDRGIYALEQPGMFIDIGTPNDYARAQAICDRLYAAASQRQ
jgi:NDP-sugar pyrophosphorylase family protein